MNWVCLPAIRRNLASRHQRNAQTAKLRNADQHEQANRHPRLGASPASATRRSGLLRERSERLGHASAASYTPPPAQRATPPVNHHRPIPPHATTRRNESLTPASHRNAAPPRSRRQRQYILRTGTPIRVHVDPAIPRQPAGLVQPGRIRPFGQNHHRSIRPLSPPSNPSSPRDGHRQSNHTQQARAERSTGTRSQPVRKRDLRMNAGSTRSGKDRAGGSGNIRSECGTRFGVPSILPSPVVPHGTDRKDRKARPGHPPSRRHSFDRNTRRAQPTRAENQTHATMPTRVALKRQQGRPVPAAAKNLHSSRS